MAGFILYEGASLYDGKPIVVIATMETRNAKTGSGMIQTWVMLQNVNPIEASRTGQDSIDWVKKYYLPKVKVVTA